MKWLYRREGRLVAKDEVRIADSVDYSSFVSEEEAGLIRDRVHRPASVLAIRNGTDCDYFDPTLAFESPFPASERALVFTGAMDYWANADAVKWFAETVLPRVREKFHDVVFYIVGSKPTAAVRKLGQQQGVVVTGRVEDVRPYQAAASALVAPLKLARGVQNKVLEAMAMARPIVATTAAMEGIGKHALPGLLVADSEADFANACLRHLQSPPGPGSTASLRQLVQERFSWQENLRPLIDLIAARQEQTS